MSIFKRKNKSQNISTSSSSTQSMEIIKRLVKLYANNPDAPTPIEMLAITVIAYPLNTCEYDTIFTDNSLSLNETIIATAFIIQTSVAERLLQENPHLYEGFYYEFLDLISVYIGMNVNMEEETADEFFIDRWKYYMDLSETNNSYNALFSETLKSLQRILEYEKYCYHNKTGFPQTGEIFNSFPVIDLTEQLQNKIAIDAYYSAFPTVFQRSISDAVDYIKKRVY